MKALIPLPQAIPQKLRKFFFRPIKKIFVSGFKWGKDSTPAKFQLDLFIAVGGVDGQTNKHTLT